MVIENVLTDNPVYAGQMIIRPEPCGLAAARQQIHRVASELDFSDDDIACFVLAVGEAISNAYRHGTPDIRENYIYLGWQFADNILTVTIKDEGEGFTPGSCGSDDTQCINTSGYGLNIMHSSMDAVDFEFDNGSTVVLAKKWKADCGKRREGSLSFTT